MFYNFTVLAKPNGPVCNLDCTYCYYLEKENLYPFTRNFRMSDETLEIFTRKYIHEQPATEITFVWQGGEPTLLGIDYFKKALALQRKYSAGKKINNSFQTNGTLLTDEWCSFFKSHNFLVGISIDGPEELHDKYRVDKGEKGTFAKVMRAIELLKKHQVEFNTLTVVNSINSERPVEVYNFLKRIGSKYIQFIPIVDPDPDSKSTNSQVFPWSVGPTEYGRFLIHIFNDWVRKDVGKYFVQIFDATLANEVGMQPGVCVFSKYCGNCLAIEHNGDVYSCDHFVYPEFRLGNIHNLSFPKLIALPSQVKFSQNKHSSLAPECLKCEAYKYCRGECPKNWLIQSSDGKARLNYLCPGYKLFFRFARPYMNFMATELRNRRSPANVMNWARKRTFKVDDNKNF